MADRFLKLVNGVPRMVDATTAGLPTLYDEEITIVASSPGANELIGPVSAGTSITLPASETYDSTELEIHLNGQFLDEVTDYVYVGIVPRTQVQFTFDLEIGDVINFRITRDL